MVLKPELQSLLLNTHYTVTKCKFYEVKWGLFDEFLTKITKYENFFSKMSKNAIFSV